MLSNACLKSLKQSRMLLFLLALHHFSSINSWILNVLRVLTQKWHRTMSRCWNVNTKTSKIESKDAKDSKLKYHLGFLKMKVSKPVRVDYEWKSGRQSLFDNPQFEHNFLSTCLYPKLLSLIVRCLLSIWRRYFPYLQINSLNYSFCRWSKMLPVTKWRLRPWIRLVNIDQLLLSLCAKQHSMESMTLTGKQR